jgi:putative spermidine/putrescine transport system substrate-binding protein/spermidine/putrescine transport system substrate-binding protein
MGPSNKNGRHEGEVTRMTLLAKTPMAALAALGLIAAAAALPGTASAAEKQLSILTWEGYADPSITGPFEERTGCVITRTYVGSNDEFPAKLAAGGAVYDVITPSVDTTSIMAKMGVVEHLNTADFPEWENLIPAFRNLPGVLGPKELMEEGKTWAIPYAWGSIAWMYRSDHLTTPPTRVAQLWEDESLAGKISLWDDKTNIYAVARMLYGHDTDVYRLSDDQLAEVRDKLIELKPKVRKYWATAGELINLFANGEVSISNTWGGYQSGELLKQGIPMVEFIPEEKADGWQDAWQMVKGTPNAECAIEFLKYSITGEAQCAMVRVMGYSASNSVAAKECLTPEEYEAHHQDDMEYVEGLDFWEEPEGIERYIETWNAVKAAQ